jgi:hypothetical protein
MGVRPSDTVPLDSRSGRQRAEVVDGGEDASVQLVVHARLGVRGP